MPFSWVQPFENPLGEKGKWMCLQSALLRLVDGGVKMSFIITPMDGKHHDIMMLEA